MRKFLKTAVTAAAVTGAALLTATPASAAGFSVDVRVPGIGFSYDSGGYCDQWGCPDAFWDYPVYYCPVYFRGDWYKGPTYYRREGGRTHLRREGRLTRATLRLERPLPWHLDGEPVAERDRAELSVEPRAFRMQVTEACPWI